MLTKTVKRPTVAHCLATLVLLSLGLLVAGCRTRPPLSEQDVVCAGCVDRACAPELTACKSSAVCECLTRCYASPGPGIAPDLWCFDACGRRPSPKHAAMGACRDAHCADACSTEHPAVGPT
jgi:hypothetical protein